MSDASRPSTYVPFLDGIRGVAAFSIFVFHSWVVSGGSGGDAGSSLLRGSYLAVDVFFVVSGFVLLLPMAQRNAVGPIGPYAARRAARIAPAYYVALAGTLLAWPIADVSGFGDALRLPHPLTEISGWATLAAHLVFGQTFFNGAVGTGWFDVPWVIGFGANGVFWTLTIEACFYVVLPLIAAKYLRRPILGLGMAFVLSAVWRFVLFAMAQTGGLEVSSWTTASILGRQGVYAIPAYAFEFAIGMTLAWMYATRPRWLARVARWSTPLVAVGGMAFVLTAWAAGREFGRHDEVIEASRFLFCGANLLAGCSIGIAFMGLLFGPERLRSPWQSRPLRWLGIRSYGLYLWHLPLLLVARNYVPRTWQPIPRASTLFIMTLVPALTAAAASWRFVEAPAIAFARRRIGQRRAAATVAAG